jgi:O-antigen/teichoic acid export membrane protein
MLNHSGATAAAQPDHANLVNHHASRLPSSVKHGLTLLGGATLAQLIPAAASPVISRLFVPSAIGAFAFAAAALGVLAPIACLRYDVAIVLPEDDAQAIDLTALCLLVALAGALLTVVSLLVISLGAESETRTAAPLLLAMVPLGLVLLGFQLVVQSWSLRLHHYELQSRALVTQALVTLAAQIGLIPLLGATAMVLVLGTLAGYVALVLVYLPLLRDPIIPCLRKHYSWHGMLAALRSYVRFPLITGPYAFLGQMSVRMVVLFLAAFTAARVVGQYAVAQRVIFLPVATLMGAASQIFYSRAARRLDDPRMPHMVHTMLLAGPIIVGPYFMLVILFGEPMFELVFGHPWRQAGHFAAILAIPSMVKTLTAWLDRTYDIRNRQLLALILEAVYVAVVCAAIYLSLRLTHDANLAVALYAALTVVFYLVWMACALRVAGFPSLIGLEFVVVAAAVVGLMLGADWVARSLDAGITVRFVCALLLAAIVSFAGMRFGMGRMRVMSRIAS